MRLGQLKARMMKMTIFLELILAMFITAAIVIGMLDLVKYIGLIYTTNPIDTYDVFQKFLGHILLLVVGVELVAMLVMHTPGSVIEVLLYAIARSMLIENKGGFDFIMGIAAIAGVFAIRKFLFTDSIVSEDSKIKGDTAEEVAVSKSNEE
ncbi:MAG: phosphate-starvation-inducible PsiE family protein [Pseudomonadota bacterium]